MSEKEKGQPEGRPIPIAVVYHDSAESKPFPLYLQVTLLTRRCAISAATAEALAPLAFGAAS